MRGQWRKKQWKWKDRLPSEQSVRIALVGQPNVGKSVIFNHWTGLGAIVSNYPGTTVEILEGSVYLSHHDILAPKWHPGIKDWETESTPQKGRRFKRWSRYEDEQYFRRRRRRRRVPSRSKRYTQRGYFDPEQSVRFDIVDLPGSYTIVSPSTDDEKVTLRYLQQKNPDVIVNVVDATNLPRNLLLTIALLEFDIPMVVCLNQIDLAKRMGINIDVKALEQLLGVPVIPTIATQGYNLKLLLRTAAKFVVQSTSEHKPHRMLFPDGIEAKLQTLEVRLAQMQLCPLNLPLRIVSQQLLEEYAECAQCIESRLDQDVAVNLVAKIREDIEREFEEDIVLVLGEKRLEYATYITEQVQKGEAKRIPLNERISEVLTHRVYGLPIALLVMVGSLLFIFLMGALFEDTVGQFWDIFVDPTASFLIFNAPIPELLQFVIYYGLVLGIQGWLFIAVPFVATFYIILSILEDSGYLARIAFLLDAFMHRVGLHGRAIIPLLTGMGCNVPAILGARILNTRRERLIAGFLIVLVPCSAQLAVILGTVALYGHIVFAFIIFAIVIGLIIGLGALLQHTLPGASHGLVMEVPPLRIPRPKPILKKTWIRFKEFVYIALPMIIIGGAILGILLEYGYLQMIMVPLSPLVVGWLGLPMETGAAFIYGILRKELTVELLLILAPGGDIATFMTIRQMFVFALVTTIYIPCIATIAVLAREYRWKYTLLLAFTTVGLAFFLGGVVNFLLLGLGIP
ncbi:MAG: ferrous iron transport protein B [Candidatus Hermodarchaeota archaeon]|nr:ferrous iron transport protein B [Candidatus Hermodarchaeota archaeon]